MMSCTPHAANARRGPAASARYGAAFSRGSTHPLICAAVACVSRRPQKPKMRWDDLQMISMLGEGSFGRVKLMLHKPDKTPYALKCLHKGQLVRYQQVRGATRSAGRCTTRRPHGPTKQPWARQR